MYAIVVCSNNSNNSMLIFKKQIALLHKKYHIEFLEFSAIKHPDLAIFHKPKDYK